MGAFTYTVFLIVTSLICALVALFAVAVIGSLFYNAHRPTEAAEPVELPRAA